MHETVQARRQEIEALCREFGVRRLDVFGSAAGTTFNAETSDVDVLVEFAGPSSAGRFDTYLKSARELTALLRGRRTRSRTACR